MLALTVALSPCAPVPLSAQCPDGSPPPCGPARGARAAAAPTSVAVLYFENLSRDTADAYLADGLTEELTGRLGDIERLRVSGRSAVRRAQRASGDDLAAVGRTLNVRYLVEGSVRRSGPQVRVSARLLRASDGVRVWGDSYDRTMTDFLALQEDIAREVTVNVAGQLLPAERVRLAARPTGDPTAYDHYLRGAYAAGRRSTAGFRQAVTEFDLAIRSDPRFAAAWARKALTMVVAYAYGVDWPDRDSLVPQAARAAARAMALDSASPDAWLARGQIAVWGDRDLPAGVAAARRAALGAPRNAEAQHQLGVMSAWIGDDTAAAASFRRALAIDPVRAVSILDLAEIALIGRDPPAAGRLLDSAIAIDPEQARPYINRATVRLLRGDATGAQADAETGLRLATPLFRTAARTRLAAALAALGDTARARAVMADTPPDAWPSALAAGLIAVGLTDSALAVLERARPLVVDWYELRFPAFDPVRGLPRFQAIEARWRDVALHPR